jgi:YVTN family beta-propeller protein
MNFGILGPLEVRDDRGAVSIGGGKQRALLALLLIHANEPLSTDTLIDELWDDEPPPTAAKILQNYVSQLRRVLGDDRLHTQLRGYAIRVAPGELDVDRFQQQFEEGRRAQAAGEHGRASLLLSEALAIWRGPPLAEFGYASFASGEIARLEELRVSALSERMDADLALGRHGELIPELETLVARHPLQERLREQLMLALYRCGRQAEALQVYQDTRRMLAEEIGIEPGRSLRQLEHSILNQDVTIGLAQSASPAPKATTTPWHKRRRRASVTTHRRLAFLSAAAALIAAAAALLFLVSGRHPATPIVRGNAVAIISLHSNRLTGAFPVGEAPTAVAVGYGSAWDSNAGAGTVSRIDLRSRTVTQTIPVGASPSGITIGGGGVWVASHDDDTVAWINPQSNTLVKKIPVGSRPTALAYGYGSVWVTNADDRSLFRIDPTRGLVTRKIAVDAVGRGLAVGGGSVWVTDESSRELLQIDPRTNKITGTQTVGTGPAGVAYAHGSIWVANALDDTVSQIDAKSLKVRQVIPVAGSPSGVAVGDGSIWVSAEFGARVIRIDPARGTIIGSIRIGNRPKGLAVGAGSLWVAVQPSGQGHYGGRLIVLDTSSLDSIDPAVSNLTTTYALLRTVYDGLTNTRPVGGSAGTEIVPDLAAALPQRSEGGLAYTFHLRPGIRYSNGKPLRAEDFRRALEREFTLNGWDAPALARIVGASRCKPHRRCDLSRGVIVNGALELTLRLTAPDPTLLYDLAPIAPVPAGTPLTDVGSKPIPSTGPYEIESYKPGRLLTIVRNPYFRLWSPTARPRGYPDEIVYRTVTNADQAVRDVLSGKADVLTEQVPSGQVSELSARYPNQLHLVSQQATVWAFMNVRRAPFDDIRVRRAVNDAIDRERMVGLHGGPLLAEPTCQLVPPTTPGYTRYCSYTVNQDASGTWKAPDLTRARQLVAASKTKREKVVVWTQPFFLREGVYFVTLLRQLGYRARLHYVRDLAQYFDELKKAPNAQAGLLAWFGAPRALDILSLFSCSESGVNPSHFCDPRIDAQIAQLARQDPSPESTRLAGRIDRELVNRAPLAPLYTPRLPDLTSPRVGNYQASPYGYPLFDQMWVR